MVYRISGGFSKFGLLELYESDGTVQKDTFGVISGTGFERGVRTEDGGLMGPQTVTLKPTIHRWRRDPGYSEEEGRFRPRTKKTPSFLK